MSIRAKNVRAKATYPSPQHERAAQAVTRFFSEQEVDTALLTCSCARGKADRSSCLDISVLIAPGRLDDQAMFHVKQSWAEFYESEHVFEELRQLGKYSHVDLDFTDGRFQPQDRGWTGGPDNFELEIGNVVAYSVPLLEHTDYFQQLREKWLPYYDDELRRERLSQARKYCLNNLDHIPMYVDRGLYFQSFQRLYDASKEFLQALFISRRIYPIAYDKWIREQIEDILGLPELYGQFVKLLEITDFESREIAHKAVELEQLFHRHVVE
jgi:hypothetical protein